MTGGEPAGPRSAPQSLQKRLPGALAWAQAGHATSSREPQPLQNFAVGGFACWHCGHAMRREGRGRGYAPSFTSMISSAKRPCASRWTAAAASLLGASTRQNTFPVPSSYQYRM